MRLYTQHFSRIFCQSRNQNGVYFVHCMAFTIRCNTADKCLCNEFYQDIQVFSFFFVLFDICIEDWNLKEKGKKLTSGSQI